MLYAIVNNEKTKADRKNREMGAVCPFCNESVIARCGDINIWHYAHKVENNCDWKEETEWHLDWKQRFPKECVEIKIGNNRADVYINGRVYEFQNSAINTTDILMRQLAFPKLTWIFNAVTWHVDLRKKGGSNYRSFRWKWPHKSLKVIDLDRCQLFLEFDDKLFEIKEIHWGGYVGGWGYIIDKDEFIKKAYRRIISK
jgi:Competence protein CoiA-like family